MGKIYFDGLKRRYTDQQIARDYFGRNREAAMRMLGLEPKPLPAAPCIPSPKAVEQGDAGVDVLRPSP